MAALVGNCDSGYSCAYSNSISWRTASSPNPRTRLILAPYSSACLATPILDPARPPRQAPRSLSAGILDFVSDDTKQQEYHRPQADPHSRKLDDNIFFSCSRKSKHSVIERGEGQRQTLPAPTMERPAGVPVDAHAEPRQVDVRPDAGRFPDRHDPRCDLHAGTGRQRPRLSRNRHLRFASPLDSPSQQPRDGREGDADQPSTTLEQSSSYFLAKLKATQGRRRHVARHSMIVYGSGLVSSRHQHDHLPVLLAGRGDGTIKPGRPVIYPAETPMANLYVAMLDCMNVKRESFGDSGRARPRQSCWYACLRRSRRYVGFRSC